MNGRRPSAVTQLLCVLAAGCLVLPVRPSPATAQTASDKERIDSQITSVQSQVQEASAEEARLLGAIDESAARKRELDAKVSALDQEVSAARANLSAAESRLAAAEAEQRGAEGRLAQTEEELAVARSRLQAYALAAYTGKSEASRWLEMTLRSNGIADVVAKQGYLKAVSETQAEAISTDERLRDQVKDQKEHLTAVRHDAELQRDAVDAERGRVQARRDQQGAVQAQAAAALAENNRLRGQAVERKQEFSAKVDELQRESAAIEATLRRRAEEAAAAAAAARNGLGTASASAPVPTAGSGGLISPVPGAPITSSFGPRVHPIYGDSRIHTGVDIGASSATPIRAAASGVIVLAESYGGYGNATIIDHGGGLATLYGHQSAILVSAGQQVTQGQVIGRVGCTGACTGPHLHFEVRVNGTPVDPVPYIF